MPSGKLDEVECINTVKVCKVNLGENGVKIIGLEEKKGNILEKMRVKINEVFES